MILIILMIVNVFSNLLLEKAYLWNSKHDNEKFNFVQSSALTLHLQFIWHSFTFPKGLITNFSQIGTFIVPIYHWSGRETCPKISGQSRRIRDTWDPYTEYISAACWNEHPALVFNGNSTSVFQKHRLHWRRHGEMASQGMNNIFYYY